MTKKSVNDAWDSTEGGGKKKSKALTIFSILSLGNQRKYVFTILLAKV